MRAGFFIREADGSVNPEGSYLEFNFPDRLAAILERGPRAERPPAERRSSFSHAASASGAAPQPIREFAPQSVRDFAPLQAPLAETSAAAEERLPRQSGRKWAWLLVWSLAVLLVAALGVRYYLAQTVTEPIGLSILERDGQLQIQWDPASRPIKAAVSGSLEIVDGAQVKNVVLTSQNLAGGRFTYQRVGGDVQVRMSVEDKNGGKSPPVASQFLGPPPAPSKNDEADLAALEKRRHELETEITQLRSENDSQAARIQQLERTLRIMQTRLGEK